MPPPSSSARFALGLLGFATGLPLFAATSSSEASPPLATTSIVARFDQNRDGRLDATERQAARSALTRETATAPKETTRTLADLTTPNDNDALPPPTAGARLSPADVPPAAGDADLYDAHTVRTLFLQFDDTDWERELVDFAATDVLVPAQLTVDGRTYAGVGVRFSPESESTPSAGYQRSLELALDFTVVGQRLGGERRLRLLDAGDDATRLRPVLYEHIARTMLPAPKASYVRVVINGEDWGVYASVQSVDDAFIAENFGADGVTGGAWWTVSAGATLADLGDDPAAYRKVYHLQSPENPAAWTRLAALCHALAQPPVNGRLSALDDLLDVEGALKFLALENAFINQSGYRATASGYALYLDPAGRFHLIPDAAADSFRLVQQRETGDAPPADSSPGRGGPSGSGGPPGGGDAPKDRAGSAPAGVAAQADTIAERYVKAQHFPRRTPTDLALLLSYSFVYRCDRDDDQKITRDEWLAFADSWWLVLTIEQPDTVTRDRLVASVRQLVTPASMADGHSVQTFGTEDPAASIGHDIAAAMDRNHDGAITHDEFRQTFADWFSAWSAVKRKKSFLTQASLRTGLTGFFTQSVFESDRSQVTVHVADGEADSDREGPGGDRRGPGGSGSGVGFGPIRVGLPHFGRGGRDGGGRRRAVVINQEELEPFAGRDPSRPLIQGLFTDVVLQLHYFGYLRDLTRDWLDWEMLGPVARDHQAAIAEIVRAGAHQAFDYTRFVQDLDQEIDRPDRPTGPGSLKGFAEARRDYLLRRRELKLLNDTPDD